VGGDAVSSARFVYALRTLVHRLGRVGGIGLALLAGAAAFHFSAVRPASRELATLQLRASEVEKRARPAVPAAVASDEIDRFVGFFPPFESAPKWLRTLYAIAEREKLELAQGSYRMTDDQVLGLAYYRILLPVRGGYPQIRGFVAGVLDEIPALALEGIALQREKVGDSMIDAKISLTLHLQAPAAAAVLASGGR
jgi:hypothetical protein